MCVDQEEYGDRPKRLEFAAGRLDSSGRGLEQDESPTIPVVWRSFGAEISSPKCQAGKQPFGTVPEYDRSLSFWTMAISYVKLVQATLGETIKQKNKWFIMSAKEMTIPEYDEATKWSDFHIIVPIMFDFYHGLELLLKGFVLLKTKDDYKLDHKISALFKDFRAMYPGEVLLSDVLGKYIADPPASALLSEFCTINSISIDRFYESLRYPCDQKKVTVFKHHCLKYRDDDGLLFFEGLVSDITTICVQSVSLGRSLKPSGDAA